MKRAVLILFILPLSVAAQIQGPPIEEERFAPQYTFGLSGAISFVDPDRLNDGIHFINTTLDLNVPRVNTVLSGGGFFRIWFQPKLYAVFRGEYIGFSRSFEFASPVTSTGSSGTSSFMITNKRRYTFIPLGVGVGFSLAKYSALEAELGFHYALGSIKESGFMEGYGSYSSEYQGTGIGFWILVRPCIRLSDAISMAPDLTGRVLVIKEMEDQRGRKLRDFEVNLSSISIGLSLIITL